MAALILGTLLALAALAYVLYPLFVEPVDGPSPPRPGAGQPMAPEPDSERSTLKRPVAQSAVSDDLLEAEIRRARQAGACLTCGPRPEPDAIYCSSCGRYLPGRCDGCGEAVDDIGARFCARCGRTLAA